MGRGNSIGTENVQRENPLPIKISLIKNVNNNNYKKCMKGAPQCNPEDLITGSRIINLSTKSKTLDFQNGNVYELHKRSHHNLQISSITSNRPLADQKSGSFQITHQDKTKTNVGTRKEAFTFWSTQAEAPESPMVKSSPAKTNGGHRSVASKKHAVSALADQGRAGGLWRTAANPCKRKRRQELFSTADFTHIDDHVLSVSSQIHSASISQQEIVHRITAKSTNDLEKLRAIWIWICHNISYDVEGFLGNSHKLYRTEDVLEKRRGVCAGYAGLCMEMCRETGICCREVSGFSRGAVCGDSVSFHRTKSNHMWNAVELAGEWYLLDACWGAGTVDLQEGRFIPRYEDFFFLTDPEDFIETHWPDNPTWQLLDSIVSFEDFERKIFKTSEFFRLQLFIISPKAFNLTTGTT
ncbi:lim and transglutaminase domain protein ltd-1-like [Phyllobates terribilis]|uniref:lim and transglutaminase domain protein ltd-1-like n=1 Tax=Phyllobates terribilis TaxID=111132 RepID=UPI003CCAD5E2